MLKATVVHKFSSDSQRKCKITAIDHFYLSCETMVESSFENCFFFGPLDFTAGQKAFHTYHSLALIK